ncbi:MAG TPA: hypothetical protein VMF65_02695 [Acidimicrobiales bacterium]|nr:hypothetical protein [Acidimicrobiales bacterium]
MRFSVSTPGANARYGNWTSDKGAAVVRRRRAMGAVTQVMVPKTGSGWSSKER